jgi:hypothetical protein
MVEDSPFGIVGYTTKANYAPSSQAVLRVDMSGDLTGVTVTDVAAQVFDPATGQVLATVTLYDDGTHHDGAAGDGSYGNTYTVPSVPATYPLAFRTTGDYEGGGGCGFSRCAYGAVNVVATGQYFTGVFDDAPATFGESLYNGLLFTAGLKVPSAGEYSLSGDLYDANGNFIDHAAQGLRTESAGMHDVQLAFSLAQSFCSQYGQPFRLKNLAVSSGASLQTVGQWLPDVPTGSYSSSQFTCKPGTPQPRLYALRPDEGAQGQTLTVLLGGQGFKAGAAVVLDQGISASQATVLSPTLITAVFSVANAATVGPHRATVTNLDGTTVTLAGAFSVHEDQKPTVKVQTPESGDAVAGTVTTSAAASDDLQVTQVVFYVDAGSVSDKTLFPFRTELDFSGLADGPHRITARAYDSKGQYSEDYVTVYKNPPDITSVTSGGSPFKVKLYGAHFKPGAEVYLGSDLSPWSKVAVKNGGLIVLKGGKSLKARFPSGVPVAIRVKNPDGSQGTIIYVRP